MHYLFLWRHPAIRHLSAADKVRVIQQAISIFRFEKSVDIISRYMVTAVLAILPAVIVFVNFSLLFAFCMFLLNMVVLEGFLAKSEVPFIADTMVDNIGAST